MVYTSVLKLQHWFQRCIDKSCFKAIVSRHIAV